MLSISPPESGFIVQHEIRESENLAPDVAQLFGTRQDRNKREWPEEFRLEPSPFTFNSSGFRRCTLQLHPPAKRVGRDAKMPRVIVLDLSQTAAAQHVISPNNQVGMSENLSHSVLCTPPATACSR